ncbi:hypothetical protein AB0M46_25370 [Dactylosporangium sp. NPDC051485]|uniref:hypothetical protein n=1 Tax=Dactylosporangium sp. NPDC051485 TaxID=3154846 RepID=UPI0034214549
MTRRRALLVTAGLLALLALCAGASVVTDLVHYATGRRGTITVQACTQDNAARKPRYECTGTFETADHAVRRDAVAFVETYAEDPGAQVPATLNGTTVNEVNPAATATGVVVTLASIAGIAALLILRRRLPAQ